MRLASVALLLAALVVPASSGAFDLACGDSPVSAEGWTPADAEQVCSAVQQTLEWLRTLGLPLAERVLARPLDVQGFPAGEPPIGRYDPEANEIQILPFAAAVRAAVEKRPACGVPMTEAVWRAFVAHETAHAVAARQFAPGVPRQTASEYLASVALLTALPDAVRTAVFANYPDAPGWGSPREITMVYYFMEPCAFAVKSYRHFTALAPSGQREFIRRLVREGLSD